MITSTLQFTSAQPELDTLARSPLEAMRRFDLFKRAVSEKKLDGDGPMPTKEALISIIVGESPKKDEVDISQFLEMKFFTLRKECKDRGIPFERDDKKDVLIQRLKNYLENS